MTSGLSPNKFIVPDRLYERIITSALTGLGVLRPDLVARDLLVQHPREVACADHLTVLDDILQECTPLIHQQQQQQPTSERVKVFKDLVRSEHEFMQDMYDLQVSYLVPMRWSPAVPAGDFCDIFGNFEAVYKVHVSILNRLQNMLVDQWPSLDRIGAAFLEIAPDLRVHEEYLANFMTAQAALKRMANNPAFADLLKTLHSNVKSGMEIIDFLSRPFNRIGKYAATLERLVQLTSPSHPDYDALESATATLRAAFDLAAVAKARRAIVDIKNKLVGKSLPASLDLTGQVLLCQGPISLSHTKRLRQVRSEYQYHLFSDVLLLCKPNKGGGQLKVKACLPLKDCRVVIDPASPSSTPSSSSSSSDIRGKVSSDSLFAEPFTIMHTPASASYKLNIVNQQDRRKFLAEIRGRIALLSDEVTTHVFGVPIELLVRMGDVSVPGVPVVVSCMVSQLQQQNGLRTEGLFRLAPDEGDMKAFVAAIEVEGAKPGPISELNMLAIISRFEPHVIATGLKRFFGRLPTPIIPYDMYEPIVQAGPPGPARIGRLTQLMMTNMTAGPDRDTLQYLLRFLYDVGQFTEFNRMTHQNLAIVFGPNLLRPRVHSMQTMLAQPMANEVLADIIRNVDQILP
eukprot:TRINITY_DN6728_c0_g1_i3.p1 TRINITY_DN6728_c0_g1~~TRINITY_DN6728_c0_g1_i3.p1  ORF type:complete len:647 (-),score=130.55 TRINITY_DN6728_c0_g1_i3:41-1924(-)